MPLEVQTENIVGAAASGSAASATNVATPRYRLRHHVQLVLQDGVARLLDLNRGRFFALDAIGTQLLHLTLTVGVTEAADRIAQEYSVPILQVQGDLNKLLSDLCRRRLIEVIPPLRRLPGRLTILLMLTWAWMSLRLFGWVQTVRRGQRGRVPLEKDRSQDDMVEVVRAVDDAVRRAASVHPLNPQCKERALVGWKILRGRLGLPAELVVGINFYPFRLHAWVECGPWTVTDDVAQCNDYQPVIRYT